jgi:hypothetical protein
MSPSSAALSPNSYRYVIACLRNVVFNDERLFRFQLYDSKTGGPPGSCAWIRRRGTRFSPSPTRPPKCSSTTPPRLSRPEAQMVPSVRSTSGGASSSDENPVLRDMPLPKPSRKNRRNFCQGWPLLFKDITVACQEQDIKGHQVCRDGNSSWGCPIISQL